MLDHCNLHLLCLSPLHLYFFFSFIFSTFRGLPENHDHEGGEETDLTFNMLQEILYWSWAAMMMPVFVAFLVVILFSWIGSCCSLRCLTWGAFSRLCIMLHLHWDTSTGLIWIVQQCPQKSCWSCRVECEGNQYRVELCCGFFFSSLTPLIPFR